MRQDQLGICELTPIPLIPVARLKRVILENLLKILFLNYVWYTIISIEAVQVCVW